MAVRRRPASTPKPAADGAEVLLHWDRWQRVPGKWVNHDDPEVAFLAAVTADVVRFFYRVAYSETDYEREDARESLRMAYGRMNAARWRFAKSRGLEWTAVEPGGRLVKRQD